LIEKHAKRTCLSASRERSKVPAEGPGDLNPAARIATYTAVRGFIRKNTEQDNQRVNELFYW